MVRLLRLLLCCFCASPFLFLRQTPAQCKTVVLRTETSLAPAAGVPTTGVEGEGRRTTTTTQHWLVVEQKLFPKRHGQQRLGYDVSETKLVLAFPHHDPQQQQQQQQLMPEQLLFAFLPVKKCV